jgi:hypothetical protein
VTKKENDILTQTILPTPLNAFEAPQLLEYL